MDKCKEKKGSAYIMVVFASFPIMLVALAALVVSVNSRNISARHTDFFGMYELASAANIFAILIFEEAYLANRAAAHEATLLHFEELPFGDYEERVICLVDYANQYRSFLLAVMWEHLEESFGQQGNTLMRNFEINLGTEHVFYGTIRITRQNDRIIFRSEVAKDSANIVLMRSTVQGIVEWPAPTAAIVYLNEIFQIKNLDYFTPWVVELKKL